jgi:EAL domain-containing protein (putative c-di-GMP-specific phosphodiesterase class I)/FixJ family two-component response regulator
MIGFGSSMANPGDQEQPPSHGVALVVDDDDGVRRDFARILQHCGFRVVQATNGAEAVERLKGASFEIILSDLEMPGSTGIDLLKAVRHYDLDIPVILITGKPDLSSAMQAVEYGAFRYLTKPIELEELSRVARQAATMHRLAKLKREALDVIGAEGRQLGDRASLDARFNLALDKLWIAFQPIVHLAERKAVAYEALVRSNEPTLKTPLDLLDAAERLDRMHDLSRRIRHLVAETAPQAPFGALLFINLHARDLNDDELYSVGSPLASIAGRVVLELTERASLKDVPSLVPKIARLRQLGFRVAIDDLGAGYAGLSSFTQLEPDFVKLDMSLVRGVDRSERKQRVIRAMNRLCETELSIQVVTEGVETVAEREALLREGCSLLQGYLFAKPAQGFPIPDWQD